MGDVVRVKLTIGIVSDTLYEVSDGATHYAVRTTSDRGRNLYCLYKYLYNDNYCADTEDEKFICIKDSLGECLNVIFENKIGGISK